MMELSWSMHELHLRHTFRISRSARSSASVVIVELLHDGAVGRGESSPSARYHETPESVTAFLSSLSLQQFGDPFAVSEIMEYLEQVAADNTSAKCAVDLALHDWIGKKTGLPVYKYLGLSSRVKAISSFTIGIDTPEVIAQKIAEAEAYPILKIKLGSAEDKEIIRTIRGLTGKTLRVDANEGWKDRTTAISMIKWLADQNVEFIEQPMPALQLDDIRWLKERSPLPLVADESVVRLADLPELASAFHGINIKLMKCTGLHEAMKMIHTAEALGMSVMLGCMIESAVGISAAAQLASTADYLDLDGNVLIDNDPFAGSR
ncbi:MAG: dipeptide epimerase, partial [Ignavibacteriales bacterium]|nr:dipeptide epimerase [Ignavibacteriales bacterium]